MNAEELLFTALTCCFVLFGPYLFLLCLRRAANLIPQSHSPLLEGLQDFLQEPNIGWVYTPVRLADNFTSISFEKHSIYFLDGKPTSWLFLQGTLNGVNIFDLLDEKEREKIKEELLEFYQQHHKEFCSRTHFLAMLESRKSVILEDINRDFKPPSKESQP